ncbi:nitroreductase [Dyadobacter subterraneus]|uniref:Putative NAD(P)H nitroreductase n=1 Tax=Dyadobacter subterraneus TaxID=2773304 RepID=A0ABR9WHF8_9BACT|nr:nitroreductase [Dyadobacter subterraneus]MBE9464852.1 nitroreductase [Dyadobacter subterraneus]
MSTILESINQVIRNRRSIFPPSYIEKEIPKELIQTILENANFAPTHKLTEPWRFRVFTGAGLVQLADFMGAAYKANTMPETFSEAKYEGTRSKSLKSAAVIAIIMETHAEKIPEWEEVAAVACAVQNMWLTATANNIGAYWSSPSVTDALKAFLELKENQKCIGFFYMGYHNLGEISVRRTPIEDKVTWIN